MKKKLNGLTLIELATSGAILSITFWLVGALAAITPKMAKRISEDAEASEAAVQTLIDMVATVRTANKCEKKTAAPLQWLECEGQYAAGVLTRIRFVWSVDLSDREFGVKKQNWDGSNWRNLAETKGPFRIEICDGYERAAGTCLLASPQWNAVATSNQVFNFRANVELPSGHLYHYQSAVFVRNPGVDPLYTYQMTRVTR